MTLAEALMHMTVRLECKLAGNSSITGTGFFFKFEIDDQTIIPVIVTNKHVIEGSEVGSFVLTKADDQGQPIRGETVPVQLANFESRWVKHPDKNVDLAVFPLAELLNEADSKGLRIFTPYMEERLVATPEKLANLSGLESITMIGYPNGIWDQVNNMPIARRGITATNPKYDYNGLPVFVIDCACFPGSSGSPVLIFDQGSFSDANGSVIVSGGRLILLGVLFAGPQHVAQGEIKTIDVPLVHTPISLSKIPNNLGFVVKAEKIADFRKLLLPKTSGQL